MAEVTLGKLLYESPLTHGVGREEWFMEGGGAATWEADCLKLRSRWFSEERSRVETDHFTIWLNREFPADQVVEWEFRFPPKEENNDGLAILFFCGKGLKGEDALDPRLMKRNGIFERYYDGDINCFHTSYLAIGRGTANLRKNKGFYLPATGWDLSSKFPPLAWHKVRVTKCGGLVELRLNGEVSFAWEDDGKQFGPRIGGGKLAFRQQNNLLWGEYRNLKVWEATCGK